MKKSEFVISVFQLSLALLLFAFYTLALAFRIPAPSQFHSYSLLNLTSNCSTNTLQNSFKSYQGQTSAMAGLEGFGLSLNLSLSAISIYLLYLLIATPKDEAQQDQSKNFKKKVVISYWVVFAISFIISAVLAMVVYLAEQKIAKNTACLPEFQLSFLRTFGLATGPHSQTVLGIFILSSINLLVRVMLSANWRCFWQLQYEPNIDSKRQQTLQNITNIKHVHYQIKNQQEPQVSRRSSVNDLSRQESKSNQKNYSSYTGTAKIKEQRVTVLKPELSSRSIKTGKKTLLSQL